MSEVAEAPIAEQVAPSTTPDFGGLPTVTPEMRAAFQNPAARPAEAATAPTPAIPAADAPPPVAAPPAEKQPEPPATPDYSPFLKELGYESAEALKARLDGVKDYETLKANQRDAHDAAVRGLLADPQKARAYFDLQALPVDALAQGGDEQRRELLFQKYKLDHPGYSAERAEVEFEEEFENKYALAASEEVADPAVRRAKLRYNDDVAAAAPAVKAAQEAARIALVPAPAEAANPLPKEVRERLDAEWLQGVQTVLGKPTIEQVFQTENGPVAVAFNTKDPAFAAFLDNPEKAVIAYLNQVGFPKGFDQPADLPALAQAYARLTNPEAIASAAVRVGRDSVGAHLPLDKRVNPAPDAPQAPAGQGEDQAGALAALRAVAQRR